MTVEHREIPHSQAVSRRHISRLEVAGTNENEQETNMLTRILGRLAPEPEHRRPLEDVLVGMAAAPDGERALAG